MAKDFKEFAAWQRAHALRKAVWTAVNLAPDMDLRLRTQWTDAAGSICRNIAEGFGRRSHRDFARFLDQATSSLKEVEDCIIEAEMRGHLNPQQVAILEGLVRAVSSPLAGLIRYLRNNPDIY
jgi:four helix bundle protein